MALNIKNAEVERLAEEVARLTGGASWATDPMEYDHRHVGLLAIAFREPGCEALVDRIAGADAVAAGTPTLG